MGVSHDGSSANCPDRNYILSTLLPGGASAETWSACSRRTIQGFLRWVNGGGGGGGGGGGLEEDTIIFIDSW